MFSMKLGAIENGRQLENLNEITLANYKVHAHY